MKLHSDDISSIRKKVVQENRQLIFIGTDRLEECCIKSYAILDDTSQIVELDDKFKVGEFMFGVATKRIIRLSDFLKSKIESNYLFVVVANDFMAYFEVLSKVAEFKNDDFYFYAPTVGHMPIPYDMPQLMSNAIIPKTIHYIWFGENKISDKKIHYIEQWKERCPDFDIMCWTEENYDVNKHPYMSKAYKEGHYAHASDYARLDIIYEHGGIYLDTDVEVLKNLNDLLYSEAFFCMSATGIIGTGCGFGAKSQHEMVGLMRDYYDDKLPSSDFEILRTQDNGTHETKLFAQHGFISENKLQIINGAVVYPTDVMAPLNWELYPLAFTKNTHAINHFDASWYDEKTMKDRKIQLKLREEFCSKFDTESLIQNCCDSSI